MDDQIENPNDFREVNEKKTLLHIFPEELWLQIFEALDDHSILINCSMASSFLRTLLKPKSTLYQFQPVLQVFSKPSLLEWFTSKDLLNLRLVRTTWKSEISIHLEQLSHHENIHFYQQATKRHPHAIHFSPYRTAILDKLESEIMPLLSSQSYRSSTPFPSRYLRIMDDELINSLTREGLVRMVPNLRPFYTLTKRFLRIAGHHFRYAHISCGFMAPRMDWYNLLNKFCRLMPNLRSLYIYCSYTWPQRSNFQINEATPFYTLSNLELLSFDNAPKAAINIIMGRNSNVKVLILPNVCGPAPGPHLLLNDPMETLNFESMQNVEMASMTLKTVDDFNSMRVEWNLTALHLGFTTGIRFEWYGIFRKLEHYNDTLTELNLCLPSGATREAKVGNLRVSGRSRLNLPKLKILRLEIEDYCSLDFLLHLHSLEHLSLHLNYMEHQWLNTTAEINRQVININRGFINRFRECNIWNLIPSLQTVALKANFMTEVKYRRSRH